MVVFRYISKKKQEVVGILSNASQAPLRGLVYATFPVKVYNKGCLTCLASFLLHKYANDKIFLQVAIN